MKNDLKATMQLMDAKSILETVREPFLVLDPDFKILFANSSFYANFKIEPHETTGMYIFELGNWQWNIPELRRLLEDLLPDKEIINDFEIDHTFPIIGHTVMLLNARQIYYENNGASKIFLALEVITERKSAPERFEKIVCEMQDTLAREKTLGGLLPICASCKKIRDSSGHWKQIEIYICDHSDAKFTHSICPECKEKLYPEFFKESESVMRWE